MLTLSKRLVDVAAADGADAVDSVTVVVAVAMSLEGPTSLLASSRLVVVILCRSSSIIVAAAGGSSFLVHIIIVGEGCYSSL